MSALKSSPAPSRQRLGLSLFVLATAQLVIALDFNVVYVALPSIGSGLGFSAQDLQWVVSAYVVATAGFLLLGGRATDLLGRSSWPPRCCTRAPRSWADWPDPPPFWWPSAPSRASAGHCCFPPLSL
ncbi:MULTISPECIES: hypothetical protein [unclassified Streptomyces]|uniref:hypothetical protein n=1 Tax=unclassified Streptomyces TaxID=2593676 RepID=UPI0032D599B9